MIYTPSEAQIDALREVANIGCGHAATALSKLVGGRTVHIAVPRVMVVSGGPELTQLIGDARAPLVSIRFSLEGELSGQLLLALPEADAQALCTFLLGVPFEGELDKVQQSALTEAANIVASACLNAIGGLTSLKLLPSTPSLVRDAAANILERAPTGLVVVLEARFQAATAPTIGGQLLVLPNPESLQQLFARLGV